MNDMARPIVDLRLRDMDLDPDIAWQQLRDEVEAEFIDWQRADYDNRESEDLGNWIANKARWNAPNRYGDALAWNERVSDERLRFLSKGQRHFERNGR